VSVIVAVAVMVGVLLGVGVGSSGPWLSLSSTIPKA